MQRAAPMCILLTSRSDTERVEAWDIVYSVRKLHILSSNSWTHACALALSLTAAHGYPDTLTHHTAHAPTRLKCILMRTGPPWWQRKMQWRWLHHTPSFPNLSRSKRLTLSALVPLSWSNLCKVPTSQAAPSSPEEEENTRPSGFNPKCMRLPAMTFGVAGYSPPCILMLASRN